MIRGSGVGRCYILNRTWKFDNKIDYNNINITNTEISAYCR